MALTYVDSCVLIAAALGDDAAHPVALGILTDATRTFSSSDFVRLELIPSCVRLKKDEEREFYEQFFNNVVKWATTDKSLIDEATDECGRVNGLGAMDGIHVAAAFQTGSDELITAENPTKPLLHATLLTVKTIRP